MLSIGPFSVKVMAVAIATLLAWLVARFAQRDRQDNRQKTASALVIDALLIGLIAARAAYVAHWWPEYSAVPASIVSIGDGGFTWWVGLPVALVYVWCRARRMPRVARPALLGIAAGMLAWSAAQGLLASLQQDAPRLSVQHLDAAATRCAASPDFTGKPVIVNLWATWCPPCQREMPILAQAQQDHPEIAVLMVNQGEDAQTVRAFLARKGLHFDHVLLDPSSGTMRTYRSQGLPTTLFFDAEGKLVESHIGEITAARLKDAVNRHFALSRPAQPLRERTPTRPST
ncbi:TlpA disulfide reductase family protein [Burkholderia multivorans]|uniref:TlpA disulfide reductase family protein n=1 Tax=Burkholderia multivorans TaxID=87883 RepID=UPI000D355D1F|nr:TlpA disulfide reductase family protein [Burkholderia multivorans]MBR8021817.1 TlpA family protein disulfide reductase [Burkholderia multivorans]MEB2512223.1 TlpA disulfide reductase family protein [Burkholderia multivorans]MEB2521525.1 TlpA disulfide reductase family protein [Burkholderia multivorans]MEB2575821.1 TlpA disulfide reductase family protein [Burkholderia multivorans]MEB2591538.1 TlpA disulfide reductase family protein [Burkholderia multivorans]